MSKILVLLSAILVVLGICAGFYSPVPRDECRKSIDQVHKYVNDKFDKMPASEKKKHAQSQLNEALEEIKKYLPETIPVSEVSHDMTMPTGEYIMCKISLALRLSQLIESVDEAYEKFKKNASNL